jgi:hypothetical protein
VALVLAGALGTGLWYSQYTFLPHDDAPVGVLVNFVLMFLGAPLIFVFGRPALGYAGGVVFIGACLWFALTWLRDTARHGPMYLALLVVLAFIGVTAVAASLSRALISPGQAIQTRYTTPVLLGWSVLALLCAYTWQARPRAWTIAVVLGLLVAATLLPVQMQVFNDAGPASQQRKLFGATALKIGIDDAVALGNLHWSDENRRMDRLIDIASRAAKAGLPMSFHPTLDAAVAKLGAPAHAGFHQCMGNLDQIDDLQGQLPYNRVYGWAYDNDAKHVPDFVYFASDGVIVGVAPTGAPRGDVARLVDKRARYGGFSGYVKATPEKPTIVCAN